MLKSLTFSLSLAVALGLCSVSKAGLHDSNCATCGLASPQGVVASPQGSYVGCGDACGAPKHKWSMPKLGGMFHHSVSYEWVLKKKHNFSLGRNNCNTCGSAPVYATGQHVGPSGQHYGASAQYPAPQTYGTGQRAFLPARSATSIASVPAEMTPAVASGEEVPPAPEVRGSTTIGSQNGLLLPTPSGN